MVRIALALGVLIASAGWAEDLDEVTLKNGSVLRGRLEEFNPNGQGVLKTSDGGVAKFEASEVVKMAKVAKPTQRPLNIHPIVAGVGFGVTYLATLVVHAALRASFFFPTVIPIGGPLATVLVVNNTPGAYFLPGGDAMLIASTLVQTGFAAYLVVGSVLGRQQVSLIPTGTGAAIAGTF